MKRPRIGVSANLFPAVRRKFYDNKALFVAERSMVDRVIGAGGVPLVLPITDDPHVREAHLELCDGLLLTGGADVDPGSYGQESRGWPGQPERDDFELWLMNGTRAARRPVLGVCRGLQVMNVGFGGTLLQDVQTERPQCHVHRDQEMYDTLRHPVSLKAGSLVAQLHGGELEVVCNSIHHQAVDRLGEGLVATAWSDDGLIEAFEAPGDAWTHGVQWHPEWDPAQPHVDLFQRFVDACRG